MPRKKNIRRRLAVSYSDYNRREEGFGVTTIKKVDRAKELLDEAIDHICEVVK